jgi:hypothetical protein
MRFAFDILWLVGYDRNGWSRSFWGVGECSPSFGKKERFP